MRSLIGSPLIGGGPRWLIVKSPAAASRYRLGKDSPAMRSLPVFHDLRAFLSHAEASR